MIETFEPKIIAFLCNWCSYAGADMAGISRIQYRPNIRVVRVMCSGRVNPAFIFEAFLSGFDGALVLGCHPGECHYLTGNYQAEKLMNRVRKLMEIAAISPQRLHLGWVSAAEGVRFAQIVDSFIERVRREGPLGRDAYLLQRLEARFAHRHDFAPGGERERDEIVEEGRHCRVSRNPLPARGGGTGWGETPLVASLDRASLDALNRRTVRKGGPEGPRSISRRRRFTPPPAPSPSPRGEGKHSERAP